MKKLLKLLSALVASLLAWLGFAYAQPASFSFAPPTEREDSTALPPEEIANYRLYCDGELKAIIPFPATEVIQEFGIGPHSCYATVTDTYNIESLASNVVEFTITPARPKPPTITLN